MTRKMFVNLPVRDLEKSKAFYGALGFSFNPQFTDHTAACMIVSEHNYVMLLTHAKFNHFATKPIPDAQATTGVLVALALEDAAAVDAMVAAALANGGKEPVAKRDYSFMIQRTFEDPDGHTWEPFWMNPAHVQPAT